MKKRKETESKRGLRGMKKKNKNKNKKTKKQKEEEEEEEEEEGGKLYPTRISNVLHFARYSVARY
jgi:hypothetical protein